MFFKVHRGMRDAPCPSWNCLSLCEGVSQSDCMTRHEFGTVTDLLDRVDKIPTPVIPSSRKARPGKKRKKPESNPEPQALRLAELILSLADERRALREEEQHTKVVRLHTRGDVVNHGLCMECLGLAGGRAQGRRKKMKKQKYTAAIGEGYFGKVFRVSMPTQDRDLAVKMQELHTKQNRTPLDRQLLRWRQEVLFATRAADLGVGPRVHDAFICTRQGRTFGLIAMDFVRGVSLATWRTKRAAFPDDVRRAEELAVQKATRLHAAGMFHGDLHAGNIVVVPKHVRTVRKEMISSGVSDVWVVDYGFGMDAKTLAEQDIEFIDTLVDGRQLRPDDTTAIERARVVAETLFGR